MNSASFDLSSIATETITRAKLSGRETKCSKTFLTVNLSIGKEQIIEASVAG
jgi:hypothetical protein